MQRAALHAAAVAVSVENITVKSTPKKTVFVTAKHQEQRLAKGTDIDRPKGTFKSYRHAGNNFLQEECHD